MLQLRPNCELCDRNLPPGASDAMICTYECTFCATCVDNVLRNVCPNCGGGFTPRPIRPATAHRDGVSRNHQPPSTERVHARFSREAIKAFAATLADTPPSER